MVTWFRLKLSETATAYLTYLPADCEGNSCNLSRSQPQTKTSTKCEGEISVLPASPDARKVAREPLLEIGRKEQRAKHTRGVVPVGSTYRVD